MPRSGNAHFQTLATLAAAPAILSALVVTALALQSTALYAVEPPRPDQPKIDQPKSQPKADAPKAEAAKPDPAKTDNAETDNAKSDNANSDDAKAAGVSHDRSKSTTLDDLRAVKQKLDAVMPVMSAIADPEFRKADGPTVAPLLQQAADLLDKLAAAQENPAERQGLERDRCQYLAMLATLGDQNAAATLAKLAAGDGNQTLVAKSALLLSKWWSDSKDSAAQEKLLTDYTAVAKNNTTSDNVVLTLAVMATVGPANDDLSIKAAEVLRKVMSGERARKLAAQIDPSGAQRDLLGKPLAATGRTTDGKAFSTADWKGKVVLVDFWATWCGPCNAEIPRMKEIYKTYHPKGLEMVGLACDGSDDTVNTFVKQKDMPWTQMREESQSESDPWHPLAIRWGVIGVPTMFLIDKKGVLRFIDAREDTAAKIENLLAQ